MKNKEDTRFLYTIEEKDNWYWVKTFEGKSDTLTLVAKLRTMGEACDFVQEDREARIKLECEENEHKLIMDEIGKLKIQNKLAQKIYDIWKDNDREIEFGKWLKNYIDSKLRELNELMIKKT